MRVLVVEDDQALGLFLKKGLMFEGHAVDWVSDGEAALEQAAENPPDLMVLDLSLPRRDGTEVLEEMHRCFPETSVLVLTGRSQVEERVRCLNSGADDCLLKPFSFHELSARCRAILRRCGRSTDSTLRFGDVEMNRLERKVTRNGTAVELTVKEFALLEFLMRRRGQTCGRGELLQGVWSMPCDSSTNVVDVYINYLRRKLAAAGPEESGSGSMIETVRGEGYRLSVSDEPRKKMPKNAVLATDLSVAMAQGA